MFKLTDNELNNCEWTNNGKEQRESLPS